MIAALFARLFRSGPGAELDAAQDGDRRAIERFYDAHVDGLYAFVFYRVGRDASLAEDVVLSPNRPVLMIGSFTAATGMADLQGAPFRHRSLGGFLELNKPWEPESRRVWRPILKETSMLCT